VTATEWQSDFAWCVTSPLPQLVAIDDRARSARHVVEDAAPDKRVYTRVAEQDQRCTIIIAARIARELLSLREQLVDRQRCLRCRQAGRRQHRAKNRPERTHDGGFFQRNRDPPLKSRK
jgi:hypothetical protein